MHNARISKLSNKQINDKMFKFSNYLIINTFEYSFADLLISLETSFAYFFIPHLPLESFNCWQDLFSFPHNFKNSELVFIDVHIFSKNINYLCPKTSKKDEWFMLAVIKFG